MSRRALVAAWIAGVVVAGIATVAIALLLGGGAPPPAPRGLSDAGRLPAWIGSLLTFVVVVVGVATIGLGLLGSGLLGDERPPLRAAAAAGAVWWSALSVLQMGLVASELRGRSDVLDSTRFRALIVQAVLAAAAAACWWFGRRRPVHIVALVTSLAALLPVVLVGHPRSSDHPVLTGISVSAHVVSAALWVGGLAAIAWLAATGDEQWGGALPRYSRLALASVAILAASGFVTTVSRVTEPADLLDSRYGAIVTLKIVLLAGLVGAGWLQRRYVFGRPRFRRRQFLPVAAFELTTMTLAFALAVALARTPPPA